jgi:hypothetical protein
VALLASDLGARRLAYGRVAFPDEKRRREARACSFIATSRHARLRVSKATGPCEMLLDAAVLDRHDVARGSCSGVSSPRVLAVDRRAAPCSSP